MKSRYLVFIALLFSVITTSIYATNYYPTQLNQQDRYRLNYCDLNAAYSVGFSQAQQGIPLAPRFGESCSGNYDAVKLAYSRGYRAGQVAGMGYQRQCLKTTFGEVCGYSCKRGTFDKIKCARFPGQSCLIDKFGNVKCGYSCMKDNFGSVHCGKFYSSNCVKNSFGRVKCGENCRLDISGVKCDARPVYDEYFPY